MSPRLRYVAAALLPLFWLLPGATKLSADVQVKVQAGATHPRIFLTPTLLSRLRAKAAANDPDWLDLKAEADQLVTWAVPAYSQFAYPPNSIVYTYQGSGWFDAIIRLGLAYQITGNTAYADKVIEVVKVANATFAAGNLTPISVDNGWPTRMLPYGLGLAYDWVYDRMDAATRSAAILSINGWYDWYKAGGLPRGGAGGLKLLWRPYRGFRRGRACHQR